MEKNKTTIVRRSVNTTSQLFIREKEEGESRVIAGYAILFNSPSEPLWQDEDSEAREVIAPEAITADFLNRQDIKMTMFHDRQLILARSKNGEGSLSYKVDEKEYLLSLKRREPLTATRRLNLYGAVILAAVALPSQLSIMILIS